MSATWAGAHRRRRRDRLPQAAPLGEPPGADVEDIALLVDELGVTTVVDLRSTRELMTEGPAPLDAVDGVQHAHHPVLKEFLDASDTVAAALLLTAQQEDAAGTPTT